MSYPLTVVISQGQSRNPEKRQLEQTVAESAAEIGNVSVVMVPHLYDLAGSGESLSALRGVGGDIVLLSWVYERAAHWILDRGGVRGQVGEVELIRADDDEDDDQDNGDDASAQEEKQRVVDSAPRPDRRIFCLDLRVSDSGDAYAAEISRIAALPRNGSDGAAARLAAPTNDTALSLASGLEEPAPVARQSVASSEPMLFGIGAVTKVDESPSRRWYPVIDYSRCTNCMECIDFCLFGVYGVDTIETILVEQPDNCRKGCPACSRVCPENAIIFPQHKSPAIAGSPAAAGGLKIDLSKLFGAPESDEDAIAVAARERDEQLLLAGRAAVGMEVGIPKRQENKPERPNDALDDLLDQLDGLEL